MWSDRDSNPGSLAYRASTLPLSYRATRSTSYNFPLLRFVPESALSHAGTHETVPLLPALSHQMSQGRKNNVTRPGLEPRVSRLPCEHSTTELPSHSIDRLHLGVTVYLGCYILAHFGSHDIPMLGRSPIRSDLPRAV